MPVCDSSGTNILCLPEELIIAIATELDIISIIRLAKSSRAFYCYLRDGRPLCMLFRYIVPKVGFSFMFAIQCEYQRLMAQERLSLRDYRMIAPFLDHAKIAMKFIPLNVSLYLDCSSRVRESLGVLRHVMNTLSVRANNQLCSIEGQVVRAYFEKMQRDVSERACFSKNKSLVRLCVIHKALDAESFKYTVSKRLRSDVVFMCEMVRNNPLMYTCTEGAAKRSVRVFQFYIDSVEGQHPRLNRSCTKLFRMQ